MQLNAMFKIYLDKFIAVYVYPEVYVRIFFPGYTMYVWLVVALAAVQVASASKGKHE